MSDEAGDFEKSLQRIASALAQGSGGAANPPALVPAVEAGKQREIALWGMRTGRRMAMALSGAFAVLAVATHHPTGLYVALVPAAAAAFFFALETVSRRGFVYRGGQEKDPTRASIGLGVSVGKGARIDPGATVGMGASIGPGAIIESGAVIAMGASIGAGAVIESGATVSWGCDVGKNARVGKGAHVGAGSSVRKGSYVPPGTWLFAGSDWSGGDATDALAGAARAVAADGLHTNDSGAGRSALPSSAVELQKKDPRESKLLAVFTRIDAELQLAPALMREHLGTSAKGVQALRATCQSLLERERSLRSEASPEALAYLDAEREALQKRIATTSDDQVRDSLQSAVAAIEGQKQQRQLLGRSADRLDAELTRLFWTLDGLAAQLVRMRSAGADAMQAPDAALSQSVRQLQSEIEAIADALEQVAATDRGAGTSAAAKAAAPVAGGMSRELAEGPGAPAQMPDDRGEDGRDRERT